MPATYLKSQRGVHVCDMRGAEELRREAERGLRSKTHVSDQSITSWHMWSYMGTYVFALKILVLIAKGREDLKFFLLTILNL